MPTETLFVALTTFFATIGPADVALIFAALTRQETARERRVLALRAIIVSATILFFFAFFGQALLDLFGITLPALRTGGGILLLLIAIDMVFARQSGATGTTSEENAEAETREDISVFPIAMPLIAGPGAISATILLVAGAEGDQWEILTVIGALVAILGATWIMMLTAIPLQRLLGITGLHVVSRIVGVLLAALSVQFIFDGIRDSGLLS